MENQSEILFYTADDGKTKLELVEDSVCRYFRHTDDVTEIEGGKTKNDRTAITNCVK